MSKEKNVQQQVDAEKKKERVSVLEQIRRRTGLLVGIVGLALVIFILESLLGSGSSIFGGSEMSTVGSINGHKIDRNDFINRVEMQVNNYRQRNQNNDVDEGVRASIIDNTWQGYVSELVIRPQFDKIGITVGDDEVYERVVANPVQSVLQQISDPKTGRVNDQIARPDGSLDLIKWKQVIQSLPADQDASIRQMEDNVKSTRYYEKFRSIVNKGLYITSAEVKAASLEARTKANMTFVAKRFDSVSDSTIKVSDADIQKYYNDNSYKFINPETTRKIEYVTFNVLPSEKDLADIEKDAQRAADEFKGKSMKDDSSFMQQESENGTISMQDFTKKTMIVRDSSIFTSPIGTVFGPYNEGAYFKIYKLEAINPISDSGKVRHLLIAYEGSERSQATRTKDQAKKLSDSLLAELKKGGNFDMLVEQYSDDGGKRKPAVNFADPTIQDQLSQILFDVKDTNSWRGKGGNYGWIKADRQDMAPAFVQGATENRKGSLFIKESQFGYHIMEVTDESKTHHNSYKVAQIFKLISPSDETNQKIFTEANEFAGMNNTAELFDKGVEARKLTKRIGDNIKEMDRQLPGIQQAKELVKWTYSAKKGDVSIFTMADKHVVAKLTNIRNKGVLPLEEVKEEVTQKAIQQKKAEMFLNEFNTKAGSSKDVNDIAAKMGLNATKVESAVLSSNNVEALGYDPILMGTALGTKAGVTSKATVGNNGVFVLTINSVNLDPETPESLPMKKREMEQAMSSRSDYEIVNALKDISDIEDHKSRID